MKSTLLFLFVTTLTNFAFAHIDCSIQAVYTNGAIVNVEGKSIYSEAGNYDGYFAKLPGHKDYSVVVIKTPAAGDTDAGVTPSLTLKIMENYSLNSWTAATKEISKVSSDNMSSIGTSINLDDMAYAFSCEAK